MKCPICEKEMFWLYYGQFPFREPKQTDYAYCYSCDKIYLQVIDSTITWVLQSSEGKVKQ